MIFRNRSNNNHYESFRLKVDNGHELFIAQTGNPNGIPAVFLHGGPGSGCQKIHSDLFDLSRFRVILPDQRGSGQSTPKGSLNANTTTHLVSDLELIREHLGISKWIIVGGSWGSTLGIAYAELFPDKVIGLVLRAIFLGTKEELQWAFYEGPKVIRPELWRALTMLLPPEEREDPFKHLSERLINTDPLIHEPAACVWGDFEETLSQIIPAKTGPFSYSLEASIKNRKIPNTPYIENYYFNNNCFLEPNQLLKNAYILNSIPGILIQGRYDLLCPPKNADALAQSWKGSELRIIETAGHTMSDPGIQKNLMKAISEFS